MEDKLKLSPRKIVVFCILIFFIFLFFLYLHSLFSLYAGVDNERVVGIVGGLFMLMIPSIIIIGNRNNLSKERRKYWFYRDLAGEEREKKLREERAIRSSPEYIAKEKFERLVEKELARKEPEKYSTKEPGLNAVLPGLGLFIAIIYFLYLAFTHQEIDSFTWSCLGIFGIPFIMWGITSEDGIMKAKAEAYRRNPKHPLVEHDYESGYFYTNSIFKLRILQIVKAYLVVMNVVFLGGLVILGFIWLGSISIAPTTIIIILLIIIIVNQNNKK